MAYTATTWVEGVTTLGPTNMNKFELGVQATAVVADAAVPKSTVTTVGDLIVATGSGAVTRLAAGTAGQVLGGTGPTYAFPPGYEFGYDQVTANVTVSSTTEATGTTVISCAAHTFDGSPVVAEFFCPAAVVAGGVNELIRVSLFEGATQIGRLAIVLNQVAGVATAISVPGRLRFTPTAASHTYTVTAIRSSTNGTLTAGVSGTAVDSPMFIRFTKV